MVRACADPHYDRNLSAQVREQLETELRQDDLHECFIMLLVQYGLSESP